MIAKKDEKNRKDVGVQDIRPLIQNRLDDWCKKNRTGFKLKVSEDVTKEDDWTYYTVVPTKKGVRSIEYVTVLAEIEKFFYQEKHEKVLLVPAIPGEEPM